MTPSYGVFSIAKVCEIAFRSLFDGFWNASLLPKTRNLDIKVEHFVLFSTNVQSRQQATKFVLFRGK